MHSAQYGYPPLSHSQLSIDPQGGHAGRPLIRWHQNSSRKANCISRGVPEPTGVIGDTMAVFKFTVLMMLPNPVGSPMELKTIRHTSPAADPIAGD